MTVTTESCKNGAITLSRMNFSGYVGHVTIFSLMLAAACGLVARLGLGLDLMSGCLVVMHTALRCHCHSPIWALKLSRLQKQSAH